MSAGKASEWLLSHNRYTPNSGRDVFQTSSKKAVTISVTGGKGGVGKTSVALMLARGLAKRGEKVLLIDCDYNLSNTAVKLGLPIQNDFQKLINGECTFDQCVHKEGNFHLLAACNGSLEAFDHPIDVDKAVIDILCQNERSYDKIILDCPAGLTREALTLNAYSDHRVMVVIPDKSSVTDSYSLMKILNQRYGITENHLLVNRVSTEGQFIRLVKAMSDTVGQFLNCRLAVMGKIRELSGGSENFDRALNGEESDIRPDFDQLIGHFSDQPVVRSPGLGWRHQDGTSIGTDGQGAL